MCGIIGGIAQCNIREILLEGLRRLEYRGYDSAGLAIVNSQKDIIRIRRVGKVQELVLATKQKLLIGNIGVAHTRWATHGIPSEANSHPHISEHIIVVHNGIIQNFEKLRKDLIKRGYFFTSDTDTEVIAHLIHWEQKCSDGSISLSKIILRMTLQLQGSYSLIIIDSRDPSRLVAVSFGNHLVIGHVSYGNFIASDQLALLPITQNFTILEDGDIVEVTNNNIMITNNLGKQINRTKTISNIQLNTIDKGIFCHYMQKEIYDQPSSIKSTLFDRLIDNYIDFSELGLEAEKYFNRIECIQIVACGTSYHAGMVASYWFESLSRIPCNVDIASEFRYRNLVVRKNTLLIVLSQSGETADTLMVLQQSKKLGYLCSLAICNVSGSSLTRKSDFTLLTRAGNEISVASTKSFTTQLTMLLMLVVKLGYINNMSIETQSYIISSLKVLPKRIEEIFLYDNIIKNLAEDFHDKNNVLYLGRGDQYPIAMEGALKLKETSYIHAEAYAAGELKHGPLALIDNKLPIIVIAPTNKLLEKLKFNIEEVYSRGGLLYIFSDTHSSFKDIPRIKVIKLPYVEEIISPIFYTVPLQLFSYHVALIKGTDIDKPRNLAKSVTVE